LQATSCLAQINMHSLSFWKGRLLLLGLALFAAACAEIVPPPLEDAYSEVTLTPLPTPTAEPTATSIPSGAEGIGLAFFRAWEGKDYLGMYSLLSPQSQALVDSRSFVDLYEELMATATVQAIHAQPVSARQEGERAEFSAQVTWDTAAVGQITRDHRMELVYSDGRWGVVWDESLILPELTGGNSLLMEHRIPSRANIYDVDGEALAYQGSVVTLGVIPGRIENEEGLLNTVSPLLNQTPEEVRLLYASALPDWYIPLGDITGEAMQANFAELEPHLGAGLVTEDRLSRLYTDTGVAAHIVGYTGFVPAELLEFYKSRGYRGDEQVGLAGVEEWGEEYLSGVRGGVLNLVGPNGEYINTIQEGEPKQARSVYTTIDLGFQAAVEQALAEAIETHGLAEAGSVVVLDPYTGAVKAMASYPTYNPKVFDALRVDSGDELLRVLNDPGRPLVNRVTQGEYPPGSTFKIVTFSAAVNSGLYTPTSRYTSTGTWDRLGESFIKYDWLEGGHGTIALSQALVVSCNSCFYDVGYNLDQEDPYFLPETARQFGLGAATGIQGVLENEGLIPDPDWKLENIGEGWVRGDSVNMAIGQGFVTVTPLQMAHIIAAVANGGTLYRPSLIDRIGAGGGMPEEIVPPEAQGQLPLTEENIAIIRQSLRDVASSNWGTAAYQFERLEVPVAGKTGTAETVIGEPHAWFAGYAPAEPVTLADGRVVEEPEIAVVVMVENSGEGSAVAAPIFRRIVELYYGIEPVTNYPW
jgi:penicillin-binding protein 2